ncbi:MAG: phospho-sugar mutase [Ruminococcaceae bacterium]|nr:phospho-sugar mutase [Oscillospiraceae bacterium]
MTEFEKWLNSPVVDDATKAELKEIQNNSDEILARFSHPMEFGTAGLRAVMAAGISRMNVYTVAQTTEGLARLIEDENGKDKGVAVAWDSRNNSELFAKTAARVLAAHGIKTYIFDSLRPTPELSFAILHYGCIAGINITASHNPSAYNGYKVYWADGAQLPPRHANVVSDYVSKTDIFSVEQADFDKAVEDGTIIIIGKETDDTFLDAVQNCSIDPTALKEYGNKLNIIYTPIHGTGYRLVPEILKRSGVTNLIVVKEQEVPDGNFPTVHTPNPENKECFNIAIEKVKTENIDCHLIIGTDPDADRVGIVARNDKGEFVPFTGNQVGALLADYIINSKKAQGNLPANACAIKSVVSGKLFDLVCEGEGVHHMNVLTGFKYIGEKIKEFTASREYTFILGYEESYGYLSGGYVRDKDAVAASMLIAEMAAYNMRNGTTLYQRLQELYKKYGYCKEAIINRVIGGIVPMDTMKEKMASLRACPPESIGNSKVTKVTDYMCEGTGLPKANMLSYLLENGTTVLIRPSGTEPKIKVYILTQAKDEKSADEVIEAVKADAENLI